jgi:hypothetical protein
MAYFIFACRYGGSSLRTLCESFDASHKKVLGDPPNKTENATKIKGVINANHHRQIQQRKPSPKADLFPGRRLLQKETGP